MKCYLDDEKKEKCFGCGSCEQICPKKAIKMVEDSEGFFYPVINKSLCINCGMCKKVCPFFNINKIETFSEDKYVFGGYIKQDDIRINSTSGGAFSAIAKAFCDENYLIVGACSDGLSVHHEVINNILLIDKLRKSKYSQSSMQDCYKITKKMLEDGKKVLFSGTPCQIYGLKTFLLGKEYSNLLTIEVVCEGVPSPLYIKKLNDYITQKYNSPIISLDYRYKDQKKFLFFDYAKWDFEVMKIKLENGKVLKKDRWFNPYWNIWLRHLMSRPSCYSCPFTKKDRYADITLGDLWGVHLYCPDLYGKNKGSSLVICNSEKGKKIFEKAEKNMFGHELKYNDAIKYQGPLKHSISENVDRTLFMSDLETLDYCAIVKKWYEKPSLKLIFQKYIYGNRQKIFIYNFLKKIHVKK